MAAATLFAPASSIPLVSHPYVGLRFYTERDDAELFLGGDPRTPSDHGKPARVAFDAPIRGERRRQEPLLRAGVAARLRELAQRTFREGGACVLRAGWCSAHGRTIQRPS